MNDASVPVGVTYADIEAAARRLEGVAHRTPVATSRQFDALAGCRAFFKCENLQRMGAFKFRGAYNALAALGPEERRRGVVAFSSGNHAQAVALAGRLLGIPATIVMPADAPAVKVAATRGYGAEVVFYDRAAGESREAVAERVSREKGATLIPPFDHPHVIAGQGTAAKELFEDVGELDFLFVCTGGAGLLSGCAIAASRLSPKCRVIGVEPAAGDDAARSLRTRTLQRVENPVTIADGARTQSLGAITFPLVLRHVHDIITVTDEQIVEAMRFLWERMKLVVEPTGALATAGVLSGAVDVRDARVGIILSGGNVDLKAAASLFA
ncbi:MAG TPA: threo-3-hydroxy-L-aspartate ammonia-lyase [Usitatibacter sp.]|nr:threo-3-hydroxy-L-aspartate ammonia-lyase [Usitatibacter sp.]